jgi:Uri superfamily endonuclease
MRGVYVLLIYLSVDIYLNVGALGHLLFRRGFYAYVGSAQNGLEKRLKRHFQGANKKFWHIDYLIGSRAASLVAAFYKDAGKDEECKSAREFAKAGFYVKGFGCSDCGCESHLFLFEDAAIIEDLCLKMGFKRYLAKESPHCDASGA